VVGKNMEKRNFALDTLRGVAAIGILIWHYQHFFALGKFTQPFENDLAFFYKYGWIMVDFFFSLSGFVFYKKYSEQIVKNTISLKSFVVLRLSRLYPLIVVTLLVTCLLNYILLYTQHKFFIYSTNDFTAFFLNLFFLQSGFFIVGHSFNAPSWSLGVEFWIYLIFFYLAYKSKDKLLYVTLVVALLSLSNKMPNIGLIIFSSEFSRGISSFFLGGITFFVFKGCLTFSKKQKNIFGAVTLFVSTIALILCSLKMSATPPKSIGYLMATENLSLVIFAFPLLILSFTVSPFFERMLSIKPLEVLGDISYSSYLWHVPVQLSVFILILIFDVQLDLSSKKFFFGYLFFVLLISYISTHFFEKPIQKFIRSKFL
jgi:peptidoglycan/LPS O-acetylase OafA/YrhL